MKELNRYSTQLIKELILPRLTKEINTSKKYAQLRQVFFSLILSRWFKDRYKGKPGQYSGLIDTSNLDNLNSKESWNKDYYFNEYKKSFQQGEYNLKEQITTTTGQVIRSYVSGGFSAERIDIDSFNSSSSIEDIIGWSVFVGILISGSIFVISKGWKNRKRELEAAREIERKLNVMRESIEKVLNYADKDLLLRSARNLYH